MEDRNGFRTSLLLCSTLQIYKHFLCYARFDLSAAELERSEDAPALRAIFERLESLEIDVEKLDNAGIRGGEGVATIREIAAALGLNQRYVNRLQKEWNIKPIDKGAGSSGATYRVGDFRAALERKRRAA